MEEQTILTRTEKPNSYEFGKVGNRFKVYYNEVSELKEHIEKLKNCGLYSSDDINNNKT